MRRDRPIGPAGVHLQHTYETSGDEMAARQAMKVRRRGPGEVLLGMAATAALLALVVGVPIALAMFCPSPLPGRLPTLDDFTTTLPGDAIIRVLVALVWLAWLQLAVCVVVEVSAGIRGVGVPAQVPLAGGTQSLVHRLVVAALLLFTATSAIMPAFSVRSQPPPPVLAQAAYAQPAPATLDEAAQRFAQGISADPVEKSRTTKIYRVQPPSGRHHESLWEIAEKCLGEGRRYKEIYALNKSRTQPDGSKLTQAGLIRPGWILEMPSDATGTQVVPVHDVDDYFEHGHPQPEPEPVPEPAPTESAPVEPAPTESAPAEPAPAEPPVTGRPPATGEAPEQPDRGAEPAPEPEPAPETAVPAPRPAPELSGGAGTGGADVPGRSSGGEAAPGADEPQGPQASEKAEGGDGSDAAPVADQQQPGGIGWPEGLAVASLLAAGLLAALGRRRREQMWHRGFGRMIARPDGDAAVAEQALRLGSDEDGAKLLDLGLRQMSRSLAADGRQLPTVYGVHLGTDGLDLWIAPADRNPPVPWEAYDNGQVWRLHADALPALAEADLGEVLAPYPGLVSLGTDETGRVLADLEAAHGLIALRGPVETRRAALAAVALELATNRWSDHMRVTLVGFGDELGQVAPDRIRTVASLGEALPELEGRSEEVRQALAASGADSVLTGRCRGVFGEAWMPHYLIMADQPTEQEADRLVALARTGRRMAAGYLVPGDVQGATWTWDIDEAGRLRAGVLGFDVDAQLVPEPHYRAVVELFRTAGRLDGMPLPKPGSGDEGLTVMPTGTDDRPPVVDVRLLGPIEIDAPGPMDDSRLALSTELLIYLATRPGGVHPTVLSGAVWPRGVAAAERDAAIARVSDWLGRDSRGRPNLYYDDRGRIRLGSEVRVDWSVFRWMVWRSAAEPASETAYMSHALDLVRGPLLADRPRGRYAWLAADGLEYEAVARVGDVAHRLVVLRLDDGDAVGAVAAAQAGLRFSPGDEGLWRDLLRAAHATGDKLRVRAAVEELRRSTAGEPFRDQLQPETEALVEELMPNSRPVAAHGG